MIIKLEITQEDIDSKEHRTCFCPIARAMCRKLNLTLPERMDDAKVDIWPCHFCFSSEKKGIMFASVPIPSELRDWLSAYDNYRVVKPITVEIEIPDDIIGALTA